MSNYNPYFNINRIFLISLLILTSILSYGQDWEVIRFKDDPADLSARTQPRIDKNDNPCALIKISMDSKDVKFFGDIIGEIKNEGGYWWVYVPEGTRYLTIIENNLPIELDFSEKDIDPKQKVTYILTLGRKSPAIKKYNIGDYYAKDGNYGVVFWIDATGEHGKIVSLDEVDHYVWSYRDEKTNALSSADGYYNTEMIKKSKKWDKRYPAAYWCVSHGTGWYLPASDELLQLYYSLPKVNKTLRNFGKEIGNHEYWSSTDVESVLCSRAIQVIFYESKPKVYEGDKDLQYSPYVRAVYKF